MEMNEFVDDAERISRTYTTPSTNWLELQKKISPTFVGEGVGFVLVFGEELLIEVTLFTSDKLDAFIQGGNEAIFDECRVNDETYFFCPDNDGSCAVVPLVAEIEKRSEWLEYTEPRLLEELTILAETMGNMRIELHMGTPSEFHEPFRSQKGVYHIFTHTTPMNTRDEHFPEELFGVNVETSAGYYGVFKPAKGRGYVLTDGKTDVVQVIENNIYILYSPENTMRAGRDKGITIFRKTLALIWERVLRRDNRGKEFFLFSKETGEDIGALIKEYADTSASILESEVVKKLRNIREAEELLLRLRLELGETKHMRDTLIADDFYGCRLREHLDADCVLIQNHPLVEGVRIIPSHGFEVFTRMIYIDYRGVRYRIGKFAIRFVITGKLIIWCTESEHPKSVPHPHISAWNGPCFGNATATIHEARTEYRYADTMSYILEWLTEGYTPELVIYNKVEEWPIEHTINTENA